MTCISESFHDFNESGWLKSFMGFWNVVLNSTNTGRISKCCRTNMRLFFLGFVASSSSSASKSKAPNSQFFFFFFFFFFSYSRKEHTESTCYFYVNRRARIAYTEYRIAYSEYRISYTVYFYVNAALQSRLIPRSAWDRG